MKPSSISIKAVSAAFLAAAALWSCSSEINFSDGSFDPTITFGGDSLTLPVGSTDAIRMEDFLNSDGSDIIRKDADGNYYIEVGRTFSKTVGLGDLRERIRLPHEEIPKTEYFTANIAEGVPTGYNDMFTWRTTFSDAVITYNMDLREALENVVSIDRIEFEDASLSLRIPRISSLPAGSALSVTMEFPESVRLTDNNGVPVTGNSVEMTGRFWDYGEVYFGDYRIESINLNMDEDELRSNPSVSLDFRITDATLTTTKGQGGFAGSLKLDFMLKVGEEYGGDALPSRFYGKVNLSSEDMDGGYEDNTIYLGDIPEFLMSGDVVLDFQNPAIDMTLSSDIGVPMMVDASMTSYMRDDYSSSGSTFDLSIEAPFSDDPFKSVTEKYWISPMRPSSLPAGYEWQQNSDLRDFLTRIPEMIQVDVDAYSNVNSAGLHMVDFSVDQYSLDGDLRIVLPFEFGSSLRLPLRQTLENVPSAIVDAFNSAAVSLAGNVTSTMPVDIEIRMVFLDSDMRTIGTVAAGRKIESAGADGKPVTTPIYLSSKDMQVDGDEVYAMALELVMTSDSPEALPLNDDSFIQISDIVLKVPGGITVNGNSMTF